MSEHASAFSLQFPRANQEPLRPATIKTKTGDFFVEEIMEPQLSGEGEHVWLWLEKDGQNTEYVAGQIARFAQVKKMDVGFSGLKDRWAVTRQWFSVYLGNKAEPDWSAFDCEGVSLLRVERHNKKLRRGEHSANLFRIVVRDIASLENIEKPLEQIRERGFPNYFGPQRFGFNGANLDRGVLFFERKIKASKSQRSFYLSAARSYLFNLNLAKQVEGGTWHEDTVGGPLYGDEVAGVVELSDLEKGIQDEYPSFKKGIHQNRLRLERRSYAVLPEEMTWKQSADGLELAFILPTGVFATSLLSEVFDLSQGLGEGNEGIRSAK